MNLLALLFALACERGLTQLLHLRELRWLDRYCDAAAAWLARSSSPLRLAATTLVVLVPVLPIAAVSVWLGSRLLGLPQFAFAVFVLLFSFGPRDLKDEVDDYVAALERGDQDGAAAGARELLEGDAARHRRGARAAVEEAVFVQANNRIFGVIFWFMVLGAAGAWLFRVSDLLRHRATFEALRPDATPDASSFSGALALVHGVLAWVPARLAALSYSLAGSFEDAFGSWRVAVGGPGNSLLDRSEDLLARVGRGSLQPSLAVVPASELDVATARGALRIVVRALWIWLVAVALLVLVGSAA
jgi:membrane protein required for beta-lactamase induction